MNPKSMIIEFGVIYGILYLYNRFVKKEDVDLVETAKVSAIVVLATVLADKVKARV